MESPLHIKRVDWNIKLFTKLVLITEWDIKDSVYNLFSKPAKAAEKMPNSRKSKEKMSLMYIWQIHTIIMAMF